MFELAFAIIANFAKLGEALDVLGNLRFAHKRIGSQERIARGRQVFREEHGLGDDRRDGELEQDFEHFSPPGRTHEGSTPDESFCKRGSKKGKTGFLPRSNACKLFK